MNTPTKTLRTLLYESSELENQLIALSGELDDALEQQLMQLEIAIPEKVEKYMGLIDRLEIETNNLYNKAKKYEMASKSLGNLREKLLNNVKQTMIDNSLTELGGINEIFTLSKGRSSVVIDPDAKLPPQFVEIKTETRARKDDIRKAIDSGESFEGIRLEPSIVLKRKINKGTK